MRLAALVGVEVSSGRKVVIFYKMNDDRSYAEVEHRYFAADKYSELFDLAKDYVFKRYKLKED